MPAATVISVAAEVPKRRCRGIASGHSLRNMQSDARTVEDYIAELPPERQEIVETVRDVINDKLPDGYEESMSSGMIGWQVPLARYPDTYNKQPLAYVCLASQKNYVSLYLMTVYSDKEADFRERWSPPSGKRLDMGKSCVRFTKLEDIDLELIGETIGATPVDEYIARYEGSRTR